MKIFWIDKIVIAGFVIAGFAGWIDELKFGLILTLMIIWYHFEYRIYLLNNRIDELSKYFNKAKKELDIISKERIKRNWSETEASHFFDSE